MTNNKNSIGWKFPLLIGLVIGAALLSFAFQNNHLVHVKFLIWKGEAPLSLTYFAVFAFTCIVAFLFGIANWIRRGKLKREINTLKENLEALKKEKENSNHLVQEEENE